MKNLSIELDLKNELDRAFFDNVPKSDVIQEIKPDRLTGSSEIVVAILNLSSGVISLLASYYSLKEKKIEKAILVDDKKIVLKNLSEEEIKTKIAELSETNKE